MKLIVGLGNPGSIYAHSRHNIGSSVVKALSRSYKRALKEGRDGFSLSAKIKMAERNVILARPLTFMNLSGSCVASLLKKYKIGLENLLVVCDDLDLRLGRLKLRPSGSSGGHRGLESIIDSLGSGKFARLRIGIGRPVEEIEVSEYVLTNFTNKEKDELKEIIKKAAECCSMWVVQGISKAMNVFNRNHLRCGFGGGGVGK